MPRTPCHSTAACFECGETGELQDHHVIPRSRGGQKTVPLCLVCHGKVHQKDFSTSSLVKRRMAELRSHGKRYGSIPYGKKLVDGALASCEQEHRVIQIAQLLRHTEGMTLRQIASELYEAGYRNREGREFNPNTIRRILSQIDLSAN